MPFKKTAELGQKDPNIAPGGRHGVRNIIEHGVKPKPITYRDMGKAELLKLFRKVRPHAKDAIAIMHALMMNEKVGEATRARIAADFLKSYQDLAEKTFDSDELIDPASEAAKEPAAVLHLKVVKPGLPEDAPPRIGEKRQ